MNKPIFVLGGWLNWDWGLVGLVTTSLLLSSWFMVQCSLVQHWIYICPWGTLSAVPSDSLSRTEMISLLPSIDSCYGSWIWFLYRGYPRWLINSSLFSKVIPKVFLYFPSPVLVGFDIVSNHTYRVRIWLKVIYFEYKSTMYCYSILCVGLYELCYLYELVIYNVFSFWWLHQVGNPNPNPNPNPWKCRLVILLPPSMTWGN